MGLHAAFNFLSAGLAPLAVALGSVGDLAFTALVILSMAWTLHWLVYRGEALAKAAAQELGFVYVDTGAIYRTVGLAVQRRGVDPSDPQAVVQPEEEGEEVDV